MIQDFLMTQMLKSQLSALPKDAQEKILAALKENPQFFKDLAGSIQSRIAAGEPQMSAVTSVIMEKKEETARILGQSAGA